MTGKGEKDRDSERPSDKFGAGAERNMEAQTSPLYLGQALLPPGLAQVVFQMSEFKPGLCLPSLSPGEGLGGAGFQELRLSYLGLGVSWTTWCTCGEDEETGLPELGRRGLQVLGLLPGAGGLGRLPAVRAEVYTQSQLLAGGRCLALLDFFEPDRRARSAAARACRCAVHPEIQPWS